jgi:hypothetical protein
MNSSAFGPESAYGGFNLCVHSWSPQHFASRSGASQTGFDTLLDHRTLEFSKDAAHLKERLPGGCSCIDSLLVQVKVNALAVDFIQEAHQVLQTASQPIYRPGGEDIELATHSGREHAVERGTLIPIISAAQTMIHIFLNDYPAHAFSYRAKFAELISGSLLVGGDPCVECNPFRFHEKRS